MGLVRSPDGGYTWKEDNRVDKTASLSAPLSAAWFQDIQRQAEREAIRRPVDSALASATPPPATAPTVSPTAASPTEADWLTQWRQGETAEINTMKTGYESDLAKEMQEWNDLARSNKWLTSEEYQGLVAAESYRKARTDEIAGWYKEQTAALAGQTKELEGVQKLQSTMDLQSTLLNTRLDALNSELQKPTSVDAVIGKAQDFIQAVEKQKTSLTAYRDWLRKQGTTAQDEIDQAKAQGLSSDQWVSTDDRIRELEDLITWAGEVQTQIQVQGQGPTLKPWTSEFWRERAFKPGVWGRTGLEALSSILSGMEWVDTTWSIMVAQALEPIDSLTGHQWGSSTLFGQAATPEYLDLTAWELQTLDSGIPGVKYPIYLPKHMPWERKAHELWKEEADPAARSTLAAVDPVWFIDGAVIFKYGGAALKTAAEGGKILGAGGSKLATRLALRGVEIEKLAAEAGLELRGFKNAIAISGRTPGLVEHYLPQIVRGTQVAVRGLYLPIEVGARFTLTAARDIAWLGKNMVVWGWKLATVPLKGAAWAFSHGVWRPAMAQLGKLAIPEFIKTMAVNAGYEITLLPKANRSARG